MRTVAIYGFSKHTRHLIADSTAGEVWTLNNAYNYDAPMDRVTRWYEIHSGHHLKDPEHAKFLRSRKHKFPIFMLSGAKPYYRKFWPWRDYYPRRVAYPIDEISSYIFGSTPTYMTNSIAMMIAHAIYEKVDRLEVYGVDMESGTEYAYQKAGTEFMIGYARGAGMDVPLPPNCALLNAPVYGYDAFTQHIGMAELEKHHAAYNAHLDKLKAAYQSLVSRYESGDLQVADAIAARHPDLWLYDGATAYIRDLIDRHPDTPEISRQIIERERAEMVGLLTGLNDSMNFMRGANQDISEVVRQMHTHDGAVQALNKLIRHIDFVPYDFELQHSVK